MAIIKEKTRCHFLSCKPAKKPSFTYTSRQPSGSKKKQLETTYHRFCLFQNSSDVVGLFTKTESQSFVLFQYWKDIRPGVAVSILNPKIEGLLNTSNNLLISSANPLINCAVVDRGNVLPPTVVNSTGNDYIAFSFISVTFKFENMVLRKDLCNGILCDGQVGDKGEPCCCISTESRHIPVLETFIKDSVLNGCDNQYRNIVFRSRHFVSYLVRNPSSIDLRSHLFDELDFEDSAIQQIRRIRVNGGARITGWIKPSVHHNVNDKATVELKRIHVVSVEPVNASTDDIENNKYAMVSTAAVTRAAEIVDGHATTRPRDATPPSGTAAPPSFVRARNLSG